ncbi:MAG: hypothetical protein E6R13_01445 [Spirochaetes bacterium]|nr:MAG: hypothetical protein E6R13_01445 [Spirochaetota bacterium]
MTKEPRVQAFVNQQGDTIIQMKLDDAKIILADVLDREVADSLVNVYKTRDSINKNTIELQVKEIRALQQKGFNYEQQVANLDKISKNKDTEIEKLNKSLEDEKKATKKQRRLKNLGFVGCVVLPIIVLLIAH